jgi:uncharacterized protein (TIGR02453 family)
LLQPSTFKFLKDLANHNVKEWFDANRSKYDAAKEDVVALVDELIKAHSKIDPSIAEQEGKKCVMRINRDIRFSKDKTPYKTNFGIGINKGGRKSMLAGYYIHIQPGQSFVAGGVWMPEAADLKKIRQEIDYNLPEFEKIVTNKKFITETGGLTQSEGILSRPPKGYEADNPAIEYLKLKSFIASKSFTDEEVCEKDFVKKATSVMATLQPLLDFLNKGLEE